MSDYKLLEESLDVIQKLRSWVSADYYRINILPTVVKLKDRLAQIELEKIIESNKKKMDDFEDTEPQAITDRYSIFGNLEE